MSGPSFACSGEENRLLEIYHACFPDDDAFWNWVFRRLYAPGNTLVIRQNGRIVSSLQMIPCKMRLQERLFDAHYIYAASTDPAEQGSGLMRTLLAQAEEEGKLRGQQFSVLITQEDSLLYYYARFGYSSRLMVSENAPETAVLNEAQTIRTAQEGDIPALSQIYEKETKTLLCGYRSAADWQLQLDLFGEGAKVLCESGTPAAYAFCDERGIIEAAGASAKTLAGVLTPNQAWRTVPGTDCRPMGSIKPLTAEARAVMEQTTAYLNLMYN